MPIPLVKPPGREAGSVGAAPWGASGAPGMPPSETAKRARDEGRLRYALARGRFFERVFVFPQFAGLQGATQDTQNIDVKSNGDSFVRLVALRGTFTSSTTLNGQELASLFLDFEIDGLEDFMTSGRTRQPASFDILFSNSSAPWLWLAAPPLIRVGETIAATISALARVGEDILTPQLAVRLVDDNVWCELYGS
jgi:hypothetical protein